MLEMYKGMYIAACTVECGPCTGDLICAHSYHQALYAATLPVCVLLDLMVSCATWLLCMCVFAVEAQKPTNAVIGEFKAPEEDWKKKYEEERAKRYGIISLVAAPL